MLNPFVTENNMRFGKVIRIGPVFFSYCSISYSSKYSNNVLVHNINDYKRLVILFTSMSMEVLASCKKSSLR